MGTLGDRTQKRWALIAVVAGAFGCHDAKIASTVAATDAVAVEVAAADASAAADVAAGPDIAKAKPWLPPQPAIIQLSPNEGPVGGLQTVTITGANLDAVLAVRFGESPAVSVQLLDSETLQVVTPPRPPGQVEVAILSDKRPDAVLPNAYRYLASVQVAAVQPNHGPAGGGTAVQISGAGFDAATQFLFGTRPALQVVVIDDHTATLIAPPGDGGTVPVAAVTASGQGTLKKAFTYNAVPQISSVSPAVGPVAGDFPVTLKGSGLAVAKGQVQFVAGKTALPAAIVSGNATATELVVQAPAAWQPGVWTVRYANPSGTAELANAFAYADASLGSQIAGIAPNEMAVNEGGLVAIGLAGPLANADLATAKVAVGGLLAPLDHISGPAKNTPSYATLFVKPVAPVLTAWPQAVDVSVQVGSGQLAVANGFSWLKPVAKILSVSPATLLPSGGAPVQLLVEAAQPHGGVVAAKIGALPATNLLASPLNDGKGAQQLTAHAPPGAPGPANVWVQLGDGSTAVLPNGVAFAGPTTKLFGIVPAKGAQAGGTEVTLVGDNLGLIQELRLGGQTAKSLKLLHPAALQFRTPAHKPGPVAAVATLYSGETVELPYAFTYFDPTSVENGTWGDFIDGALNVTVLKKGKIGPVPGATVLIGDDPKTPLQGLTDANGQVTLSITGLTGPLHVHAAKSGWSAASAIALGVENITLRLQEFPPPSPGSGSPNPPDPVPPPGTVSGTALDTQKYTIFPLGTCKGQPMASGHCQPCNDKLPCGAGFDCQPLQLPVGGAVLSSDATPSAGQAYCLAACATQTDCPPSYDCRGIGADLASVQFKCVPRIGEPQTRCEGSGYSIFGGAPPSPNNGIAKADGTFTVAVNPGDAAIICRSGYVDGATGEFVPLVMGMARKLFAIPGQHLSKVVVHVTVPLDRTLRVRMDRLPLGSDATGVRQLSTGIDLGAEGYFPMGSIATYQMTDTLIFERQPAPSLWSGENDDLRLEVYGGLAQVYGSPPSTTSQITNVDPRGLGRYATLNGIGGGNPSKIAISPGSIAEIAACAAAGELKVAVGQGGAILHWTGGGFTMQPSPTTGNLNAAWLAPDGKGDGWIGGAGGVLLRKTALGWKPWPQKAERDVVAIAGRAPDDVWLVDSASQLQHFDGKGWQAVGGPWAVSKPPAKNEPKAPQAQVLALWHAADGSLYLGGEGGALLRLPPGSLAAPLKFETLAVPTSLAIRGLWGDDNGVLWIVGDRGLVLRYNGIKFQVFNTTATQPLFGVRGDFSGGPVDVVGGQGTWLRVSPSGEVNDFSDPDLRVDLKGILPMFNGGKVAAGTPVVVIGPYLEFPWLVYPSVGQPVAGPKGSYKVQWTAKPGLDPTLNLVRIADAGYNTRWEIFLRGTAMQAQLPNFELLGAGNPLPGGTAYVRMWRIYAPGTEIDSYSTKNLSNSRWISWAYNVRSTDEPPVPITVPTGIDPPQLPIPDKLPK